MLFSPRRRQIIHRRRTAGAAGLTAVAAVTAMALAIPSAGAAPVADPGDLHKAPSAGRISTDATARVSDPNARVNVIVQLTGDPVAVVRAKAGRDLSRARIDQVTSSLRARQNPITGYVRGHGGRVVSQMQSAYNGVHVQIARKDVDKLASLPDVESLHSVTEYSATTGPASGGASAAGSNSYLGVPQVWQDTGHTGRNVKVAVIDTGLDYTHADFGGPGSRTAYAKALAFSSSAPDPSLVGSRAPRVKGGYDFAGNSYNSSGTGAALVPRPDSNPLDCIGHGTHVAGTLAGSGVTGSGTAFTGRYNASTATRSFLVSPGIAPQADLYPLKIFGCAGTSDLTTEAIDWAVSNHMDVINISLGSVHGRSDDPDAVAASNAVAAGTVVVAAAGNQGQSPYMAGAPSTGHGVIQVAGVNNDSTLPGYRGYAAFSSSGPANGDSSLSTGVSAPSIAISSAAIATGTAATSMSGTSAAAPQVAGVAALSVQAHPGWSADQIGATLGSTASATRVVNYDPVLGGGLVDAARAVTTTALAEGDHFREAAGTVSTASLSFGLVESSSILAGARTVTVVNNGPRTVTYSLAHRPSGSSQPATLTFSRRTVTVRPHSTATVLVTLRASASRIGSSLEDQIGFHRISGDVVLSSGRQSLRVPYLMVVRAQTNVVAARTGTPRATRLTLANPLGAVTARSGVFTWGLSDGSRDPTIAGSSGYDLRAAGVRTTELAGQKLLVFAVNSWDRWSNAASNEYDVSVDTDGDGTPDRIVFAADSGVIRRGDRNGVTEVFIQDTRTGAISASGFLAVAPTDSSTIQLPVLAADLGLSATAGDFSYTVAGYGPDGGEDTFGVQWSRYNPWTPAISDGAQLTVPVNRSTTVPLTVSAAQRTRQKPRGVMVVTPDNHSGPAQAGLLPIS